VKQRYVGIGFGLLLVFAAVLFTPGKAASPLLAVDTSFSNPVPVTIAGYDGHAMEPFISRDGALLFFNSRNQPSDQTDLHVARRRNDTLFAYLGPLEGANSAELDGVASADRQGRFHFVSTRDYARTGNTLWTATLRGHSVADPKPLRSNFTAKRLLRLNIDQEISADGETLYFAENRWDLLRSVPATSDLAMAQRSSDSFARLAESDRLTRAVNSNALEFAPATSSDERTLYFTRLDMSRLRRKQNDAFQLLVSSRPDRRAPWGKPKRIEAVRGHVEAPSVTPDDCGLYFHALTGERFEIRFTRRRNCRPR
jgi:hypothetical protein